MTILPAHVALVRRFEPILYFSRLEPFFPSDAKRYLEQCGLWNAELPFDEKNSWGGLDIPFPRRPTVKHGKIAALASEVRPGDTFLGNVLVPNSSRKEQFLDLAGWFAPVGTAPAFEGLTRARAVDSDSENRFASLSGFLGVEGLYDFSHEVIPDSNLKDSRFWYHAEAFDIGRIRQVLGRIKGLEVSSMLDNFTEPILICYYLFYPGHIAPLEGCEDSFIGPRFGSYGGEWACIILLLDRNPGQTEHTPRFIGLTSRNIGRNQFLDEERRVGMNVFNWSSATKVDDHLRLFVARNTHGIYLTPGEKPLEPFTPADPGLADCGKVESLDESIPYDDSGSRMGIFVAKMVAAVFVVGWIFVLAEGGPAKAGPAHFVVAPSPDPQKDRPPEPGQYGTVVKPQGLTLPDDGQAEQVVPWSVPQESHSTTIDGRIYSFMVDRREADPQKRQVWWPSDGTHIGYDGRWGPRVANDPRGRRAGMRFPDFAQMFFLALMKQLSK